MSNHTGITKLMAARLWQALTVEDEFTVMEVAREAKVPVRKALIYLAHCFRHGVIEQVPVVGLTSIYRKSKMVGNIEGPGSGRSMEGKVWEAIRQTRTFTVRDIAALANSEETEITEPFVQEFVSMLVQCRYVRAQKTNGRKPTGQPRFQLMKNTGPKPPVRKRVRLIVDPNLGEVVHMPSVCA